MRYYHCSHYTRWLHPIHPDTGRPAGCRFCEGSGAAYPRARVARMICAFCACAQPCAGACANPECTAHGVSHSYYCDTCHLWEDRHAVAIYHCRECRICRVGRAADFRHCGACGMCVPRRRPHQCWGATGTCPICLEDMPSSRESVLYLRCGHAAHHGCVLGWWSNRTSPTLRCMTCRRPAHEEEEEDEEEEE